MNENNSIIYQFLPQIFLRAPYYSYSGYDLSRLPEVMQEQAFRNAVWLASPEFYRLLEKKDFDFDQLKDKEKHTLCKYYNRMCFRHTPLGSFASFTLLEWGNEGQIKLATNDQAILHLLPDQQLLHGLRNDADHPLTAGNLMVNPSLYRLDNVFRYTKSTVNEKGRYSFFLEAIASVRFNARLFSFLGAKRLPSGAVMQWIMEHGECTVEEAADYTRFLLDTQTVFSDAQGHVICTHAADDWPKLHGWNEFWKTYRSVPLFGEFSLGKIALELNRISAGTNSLNAQPFYAALERPVESGGPDMAGQVELSKAVQVLQLLSVYEQPEDLSRFIREFRARFDREKVPLLIALDPDAGLPYGDMEASIPNPGILENLMFPKADNENKQLGWNAVQQMVLRLWIGDTLRDPWSPLQIREEDVVALQKGKKISITPPQTQALMYRDTGEHLIIEQAGGVTGASLIGRFSCFNEQVHAFCIELAQREVNANPGVIFADIGQLSDTHVDNINRRKPVYPYEIPVNVYPAQAEESQIRPEDLSISLQGDELILESFRLGKRVIPRLSTAYNFRNNHLPVFRLLCDLQFQGIKAGLSLDLESFFPGLPFYPRVLFGRVILSLAKWIFKDAELSLLSGKEPAESLEALQAFRKNHHIPRHISLGAHDQQLVFDLAHASDAWFFLQCIDGLKNISIMEYLMPDRSVLAGKKPLAGQMIAFLAHDKNIYKATSHAKNVITSAKSRSFMMGSNWLYLKIFCIPRAADTLLAKVIVPFLVSQRKLIKNWFFIRYTDKGYHLRLRIQADESDLGILLVALRKKMESGGYDKLVRDYQGDTYRREIERYGLRLIPHVEDLFCAGSDLTAWIIIARETNKVKWSEFELALLTADKMINCFLPTDETRLAHLDEVTAQFITEFKADKQLKTGMDTKYREMKPLITGLLNSEVKHKQFWALLKQMVELDTLTAKYSPVQKSALLAHLVHMQLNRTFSVQQRQQEMLVYYCLQKHTISRMARNKPAGYSA